MGNALPLVTLFGAVAAAVWVGGYRPAAVVCVLGYVACEYLFIEPRGSLGLATAGDVVGLAAYLFTCTLIIVFGEAARRTRARAQERHEVLRVTLGSIGDAVITTDTSGRVTYMNAVAESLTGWSQTDALGQPLDAVFKIVNEQTRKPVESPATKALRDGTVVGLANHTVLLTRDGRERAIDDSAAPITNETGDVSGCVLIFRDVSERRRMETAASDQLLSARLLASIVESSDDAIIRKSLDGIIQSWNAAAERLFGYTAEQAIGRHISMVIPPERISEEDTILAALRAGERVDHFETERIRSDGQRILVSLTISPIKDEEGRVIAASKIVRDVTRQRLAETDRQRLATVVENSTDFIGICDPQGVPLYLNRAGLDLVGLTDLDDARRFLVKDVFFPEDQRMIMEEFFPAVVARGYGEIDVRFRHFRTGEARWMAYKVLALKDVAGRIEAFATVSQDVTERRRMEDHLRRLAANLAEVDRRKDEFIATLAHELRNPLAPLRSALEIVKHTDPGDEAFHRARETMERQVGQLVRLVDDLLDLNRINLNRLELRHEEVELATVVQRALEAARPLAESMQHDVKVSLPTEPLLVHADAARLTQVFGNLLNNSCKYTPAGGTIWLTAAHQHDEAVVIVKDTGVGIPPDKLDTVFEMFTQIEGTPDHAQGGLGIGLTLVRRLVQMHGGSVDVSSEGEGRGAEFVVRLPLLAAARSPATPPPAASAEPISGLRILVVDDNRDAAESLASLLAITGHETHMAHDGVAAFEAAQALRPDVVLLDIGLPKLSGNEVCRRIREQPWGTDMTVLALTGWGQEHDRQKSSDAGFDGHLVKPIEYSALIERLESLQRAKAGA
jgi:PAS domain S-box-containing protein